MIRTLAVVAGILVVLASIGIVSWIGGWVIDRYWSLRLRWAKRRLAAAERAYRMEVERSKWLDKERDRVLAELADAVEAALQSDADEMPYLTTEQRWQLQEALQLYRKELGQ